MIEINIHTQTHTKWRSIYNQQWHCYLVKLIDHFTKRRKSSYSDDNIFIFIFGVKYVGKGRRKKTSLYHHYASICHWLWSRMLNLNKSFFFTKIFFISSISFFLTLIFSFHFHIHLIFFCFNQDQIRKSNTRISSSSSSSYGTVIAIDVCVIFITHHHQYFHL